MDRRAILGHLLHHRKANVPNFTVIGKTAKIVSAVVPWARSGAPRHPSPVEPRLENEPFRMLDHLIDQIHVLAGHGDFVVMQRKFHSRNARDIARQSGLKVVDSL
jgi:hypothetical protein